MRALPEELATTGAEPIFVDPGVGARRDAIADFFFIDQNEFAAATHEGGICIFFREVEFGADEAELFEFGEGGWNPNGADASVRDGTAVEKEAVGGDDDGSEGFGLGDEFCVPDVLNPAGVATGGAEPAGEPAEAGVEEDETLPIGDFGFGIFRSKTALTEAMEFFGKSDVQFGQGMAEARCICFCVAIGALEKPVNAFVELAGAGFG